MREAIYDEHTDTWKHPWWANDHDDGSIPCRRTILGTVYVQPGSWLFGVAKDKVLNTPGYEVQNYYQHWLTFHVGPVTLTVEWFRDTEDTP